MTRPKAPNVIQVEIANQQRLLTVDRRLLRRAVEMVLRGEGLAEAHVGLAIVDDPTIRQLNREYLKHDWATDVLSFVLERSDSRLEGEVIVGAETAERAAPEYGWTSAEELLLYVVHGALHLAGYTDKTAKSRAEMRVRERHYLEQLNVSMPSDSEPTTRSHPPTSGSRKRGRRES